MYASVPTASRGYLKQFARSLLEFSSGIAFPRDLARGKISSDHKFILVLDRVNG